MRPLYKTTVVIWSEYDGTRVELSHLAREAEQGDAYCSRSGSVLVSDPAEDEAWDGTEFFGVDDDDDDCAAVNPRDVRAILGLPAQWGEGKQQHPVYVLNYSHKHGDDTTVYATEEGARAALAEIAREYWHEAVGYAGAEEGDNFPQSPDGLTDEKAVELYFVALEGRESYEITEAML